VTIDDLAIASNQTRDLETELADRGTHAVHRRVVLAWVPGVFNDPINWPQVDMMGERLGNQR
jgi:hypothetical protein